MPPAPRVTIAPEPVDSHAARHCLDEYYRELGELFEQGFDPARSLVPSPDEFAPPRGLFLVVRLDLEPVGCGAFKPLSSRKAYLKRMWISKKARGLGLGKALLAELERQALALGYQAICLETNEVLTNAEALYRSAGYREVEPFNDEYYADTWFEKRL